MSGRPIGKVTMSATRSGGYFNALVPWLWIFWRDLGPAFPTMESAVQAIEKHHEYTGGRLIYKTARPDATEVHHG